MSIKETGGPAFPTENERQTGSNSYHYAGATLRDYFAAKAIGTSTGSPDQVAKWAFEIADAMLKEREK